MTKRKGKWDTLMESNNRAISIYGTSKISKAQAIAGNIKFYWTGELCVNGHLTYNYTSTGGCRQCSLEKSAVSAGYERSLDENINKKRDTEFDRELGKIEKDLYGYFDD